MHLDDLFELLCSDSVLLYDYETAEGMLRTLEEKADGECYMVLIHCWTTLRNVTILTCAM